MPKITVYKVKKWDVSTDEFRVSCRMASEKGAAAMGGEILHDTAVEIDASQLEHGEEWTKPNFTP